MNLKLDERFGHTGLWGREECEGEAEAEEMVH